MKKDEPFLDDKEAYKKAESDGLFYMISLFLLNLFVSYIAIYMFKKHHKE